MSEFKSTKRSTLISVLILVFVFILGGAYQTLLNAQSETTPPDFPRCEDFIFTQRGDWASHTEGVHGIPGLGNFEGSDDVYSLSRGNFFQCFCPPDNDQGIQTNWWNVERAGLTEEQISGFMAAGWLSENGAGWNLFAEEYLVKNSYFSCSEPTPTPTPIPTATPTPEPTATPTATPTPPPDDDTPRCVGLSASPTEGSAPLTVRFTGSGFDKNGPILEYEFDFGDASGNQHQVWRQKESEAAHRYEHPGTFIASLKVKDQGGTWRDGSDNCKVTITVKSTPMVLSVSIADELPSAGVSILVLTGLVPLGYYIYKRFRIV
jgi:hypothetical protein